MIYLIGGTPKCGKTTLAKKFSKTKGIPWVSTDTLQNVIKPYIDKKDFVAKFPTTNQRQATNDEKYTKYSVDEIIEAYQQQAKTVYAAIEMFVICEITDGNDFIIEGYHIEPELVRKISSQYSDMIKSVFLVKTDESKFISTIQKSTTPNDWIIERTKDQKTYTKIATMICKYGKVFETEAEKYDLRAVRMDNDFDAQIDAIIQYLIS